MPNNRDTVLLETVKTHRARLLAAFLFGELTERRLVNDNTRRVIGSVVLAAVVCAGCVGFSLVTSLIAGQAAKQGQPAPGLTPGISDQPFVSDHFDRPRENGWGVAEVGGRWNTGGNDDDYAVEGGAGVVSAAPGATRIAYLSGTAREASDLTAAVALDETRSGVVVVARRVDADSYRLLVELNADRQVSLALVSRQDDEDIPLANGVSLREPSRPGATLRVRSQAYGVNPTVVRAKVWPADEPEPTEWTVAAQDGFEALQRSGITGVGVVRPEDADGSVELSVLDFVARPVIG